MSKITNDGLTWSGTGCFTYGNIGRRRVNVKWYPSNRVISDLRWFQLLKLSV